MTHAKYDGLLPDLQNVLHSAGNLSAMIRNVTDDPDIDTDDLVALVWTAWLKAAETEKALMHLITALADSYTEARP